MLNKDLFPLYLVIFFVALFVLWTCYKAIKHNKPKVMPNQLDVVYIRFWKSWISIKHGDKIIEGEPVVHKLNDTLTVGREAKRKHYAAKEIQTAEIKAAKEAGEEYKKEELGELLYPLGNDRVVIADKKAVVEILKFFIAKYTDKDKNPPKLMHVVFQSVDQNIEKGEIAQTDIDLATDIAGAIGARHFYFYRGEQLTSEDLQAYKDYTALKLLFDQKKLPHVVHMGKHEPASKPKVTLFSIVGKVCVVLGLKKVGQKLYICN